MGNFSNSCFFCLQYKDDLKDYYNSLNEPIEPISNMRTLEEYQLFRRQYVSDPFIKYDIKDYNNKLYSKKVILKDDPNEIRLMEILPNKDQKANLNFLKMMELLLSCNNDNILQIHDLYIYENNYYLVFDYLKDNSLLEKINTSGHFDESITKIIMIYIVSTIIYLHELNIFNIGLKLDDIIFIEISMKGKRVLPGKKNKNKNNINNEEKKENENVKKQYKIKISLKNYIKDTYVINDMNTFYYYSPEIIELIDKKKIIKKDYNNNTNDIWACGVIMYYLLCGEFPFKGKTKEELFRNINEGIIDFSSPKFKNISEPCKDIISKLLEKDKNKRIKLYEFYNHLFLLGKNVEPEELLTYLNDFINVKKPQSKYHEIIIEYLCLNYIDEEEKNKLKDLYDYIIEDNKISINLKNNDEGNKKAITLKNIKNVFKRNNIGYSDENIKTIMSTFDYDEDKLITFEEFLNVLCDKKSLFDSDILLNVFKKIDIGQKDYININDIKNFIEKNEKLKKKIKNEITEPFGMSQDTKMNFILFCSVMVDNCTYDDALNKYSRKSKKKKIFI